MSMSLSKHMSVSSRMPPKAMTKHDYGVISSNGGGLDQSGGMYIPESKLATKQFLEQAHNKLQMSQNFFFRHSEKRKQTHRKSIESCGKNDGVTINFRD